MSLQQAHKCVGQQIRSQHPTMHHALPLKLWRMGVNARGGGLTGPTFLRNPCSSKTRPCCTASAVIPTPTTSPPIAAFRSSMEMVPRPRRPWPLLVMRLMISRFIRLVNSGKEMAFAAICTLRAKFRDDPIYANTMSAFAFPPQALPYYSLDSRHLFQPLFGEFWPC